MKNSLLLRIFLILNSLLFNICGSHAQQVPIGNYSTDINGQVLLEVNSSTDNYYILNVRHSPSTPFVLATSMTIGQAGTTIITEPLGAYPEDYYEVLEYSINTPFDTDGDGIDDITEYQNTPFQNPINPAETITIDNGLVSIDALLTFNELSIEPETVQWSPYLDGKEFVKFLIDDYDTPNAKIYFINTNTHPEHIGFANQMGIDHLAPDVVKGQIVYHPTVLSNNGTLGTYAFNFSNNESMDFATVQHTQELVAAGMPIVENNLSYYINAGNEGEYYSEISLYQDSRVSVLFETDVYAGLDYWGLNQTEGYGFFRLMNLNDVPGPKDIVLYESIPNSIPHVGGIITSVIQTPLSHANLRAIQDHIPNAFIRDPLDNDSIVDLLDHYIYFNAEQSSYTIREATLEEVNTWYESQRPPEGQIPPLNLDYTSIKPLDHITFDMYDGFGAKSTNVATMRTFDFSEGTIPDGFGIPFYFYQEFMKHNNFFDEVQTMMIDPNFINDRDVRDSLLAEFRHKIEEAEMPEWMLNDLAEMHASFPFGTSIRCRSSTNNEDLPGFSGAGLYESKTQHPDEGHISKSIKQVYASIWNLRAFEERDFYRIDHFYTSMGVLCHVNYSDEKVNGVGVTADPVYSTSNNFYLNSQLEGELITNPGSTTKPEELLLSKFWTGGDDYSVIQYSSLVNGDSLLMSESHMNQLRDHMAVIHHEFGILYNALENSSFAMDIEYKITSDNRLIIKQARPWVSYVYDESVQNSNSNCQLIVFPNPASESINITCRDCDLTSVRITDLTGKLVREKIINENAAGNSPVFVENLPSGVYFASGFVHNTLCAFGKFIVK
ncbi:MAG: PEP/pyruvate-binding domain-containing protein [Crocinitomicaceae bacterium]|nr:PEP/pyruvate-binding domain-containing protein [Crocinitomicaceae bacterium]